MRDDELDEVIDDAVRAVLEAAPRPGMRQRVLRRIAEGEPVRGSRRLSWAVAVASLAVCVVGGAVIVERQQSADRIAAVAPSSSRPAATDIALPAIETVQAADRGEAASAAAPDTPARPSHVSPATPERLVSVTSLPDVDDGVIVAPLTPLSDIHITPLRSGRVDLSAIEVAPLRLDPVRIDALPSMPH
jgi:hypothetical protein